MLRKESRCDSLNPYKVYTDNITVINMAKDPVQHDRTKHIKIGRHFTYEKLNSNLVELILKNSFPSCVCIGLMTFWFSK